MRPAIASALAVLLSAGQMASGYVDRTPIMPGQGNRMPTIVVPGASIMLFDEPEEMGLEPLPAPDGSMETGSGGPGSGDGSGEGGGSGGSGGGGHVGQYGIGPDIEGGAALGQSIERSKAAEQYRKERESYVRRYRGELNKRPFKQSEVQGSGEIPNSSRAFFDDQEDKNLFESGEGILLGGFRSYSQLMTDMNSNGGNVSTGSTAEENAFAGILGAVADAEALHYSDLVNRAAKDTAEINSKISRQNSSLASDILGALDKASDLLNGRHGAPYESSGEVASKIIKMLSGPSITMSVPEDRFKSGLSRMLWAVSRLPPSLQPDGLKILSRMPEHLQDMAVGVDYYSGTFRSAYECITGYNFVTGERLSDFEVGLAYFGLLTAGVGDESIRPAYQLSKYSSQFGISPKVSRFLHNVADMGKGVKGFLSKLGGWVRSPASKERGLIDDVGKSLERAHPEIKIKEFLTADELNEEYLKVRPNADRPYHANSYGIRGTLREETKFYRFSDSAGNPIPTESGPVGQWIAAAKNIDLAKLSPEEIQKMFSLTKPPKFVTDVHVPAGTMIEMSKTSTIFGGKGGVDQFRLIGEYSSKWFSNTRSLVGVPK